MKYVVIILLLAALLAVVIYNSSDLRHQLFGYSAAESKKAWERLHDETQEQADRLRVQNKCLQAKSNMLKAGESHQKIKESLEESGCSYACECK